ncbi:hypothetical protein KUTeg_009084 [Tegillarca granosa]|nr:hypothetical protein KUTeg_009084 [Tegillarca granosa]
MLFVFFKTDCKKYDSHGSLASIDSAAKMTFVSDILKVLNYLGHSKHWIGANDYAIEGQWRWIKTGQAVQYFKWAVDEPNVVGDGPEDCATIQNYNGTYLWNDEDCSKHRYYYICETPYVHVLTILFHQL